MAGVSLMLLEVLERMHRIVVTNRVGEKLSDVEVDREQTVDYVAACLSLMPTSNIYIDGRLLEDEAKAAVLKAIADAEAQATAQVGGAPGAAPADAQAAPVIGGGPASATPASAAPASPPAPPLPVPDPEQVASYLDTLSRAFDDVRRAQLQNLRDLQDCARRYSEMWMERERQFADEAARQRELTSKSLADVDLLRRCAKTTVMIEDMKDTRAERAAEALRLQDRPAQAAAAGQSLGFMDLVHGFLSLVKK